MNTSSNNIFFTSDQHFGHRNIIKYCDRPFSSCTEMREALINNWNNKIPQNGVVYYLGDIFISSPSYAHDILDRLNGHIHLIKGNHDKWIKNKSLASRFIWIKDYFELKIQDPDAHRGSQLIVLAHYAFKVWNKSHHGSWHLYGHSHGTLPDNPHSKSFDCGVDCHNYTPLSYNDVKKIMSTKNFKPIDYHNNKRRA